MTSESAAHAETLGAVETLGTKPSARASWLGSMQSALAATLTTPEWWAMALAAFLVRGGLLVVLLPIVALPTPAGLITDISPTVEALFLGTPTLAGAVLSATVLTMLVVALALAGVAGSSLDAALMREAAASDELDLAWRPMPATSGWRLFALRLVAHIPTMLALGYAIVRILLVAYAQSTTPDDPGIPIVDRVLGRVPEALLLVLVAWLIGEVVGGLAARRVAAGMPAGMALVAAIRQLLSARGVLTFVATTGLLLATSVPFALAAERSWEHVRSYLLFGADAVPLTAAIAVLVSTWVLGLTIIGAALAWRATAWTAEVTVR